MFSLMKNFKSRKGKRLADEYLAGRMQIAATEIKAHVKRLMKHNQRVKYPTND
jgi:hypothetical protein